MWGHGFKVLYLENWIKIIIQKRKKNPGSFLSDDYHFMPVGAETYGAYGPQGIKIIKQIGKNNTGSYRWKTVYFFLLQSILMSIQQGNAICIRGCPNASTGLQDLFNFHV